MNYECEADYNASMEAYAEAEAQAYYEQEYYDYLDSLIENKEYDVYGLEICFRHLTSNQYYESGLKAHEFLKQKIHELNNAKKQNEMDVIDYFGL